MWPVTSIMSNYFNDIGTADLLADGLVVFLFVHAGQTGAKVPCSAFNNFLVSVGLKGIVQLAELACWLLCPSNQLGLATGSSEHETTFTTTGPPPPHLFEFESKETVTLRADWHAGEIRQRNAGLHLARLRVSQDDVLLGQQEDSSRALRKKRAETVQARCQHDNTVPKRRMRRPRCVFKCLFFLCDL